MSTFDPRSRLSSPEIGGGALLDAGVHPISFASSILGTSTRIHAAGELVTNGVDASADMLPVTPLGRALLSTSLTTQLPTRAPISGTNGSISVAAPFFARSDVTVYRGGAWDGQKGVCSSDLLAASGDGMGQQATAFRLARG